MADCSNCKKQKHLCDCLLYSKQEKVIKSNETNEERDFCILCGKKTKEIILFTTTTKVCQTKSCRMYLK